LRDLHVDLGHTSSSGAHVSLFAGRDWMSFDQAGRAFQGGANRLPQAGDPARNWFVAHRDRVDSAGLVVQKRFFDDRLRLGGDLAWSLARGVARFSTGSALTSAPLPPSVARLQTLELDAEWTLSARVHLRLALREERFDARDGISSELAPATLANVILLGEDSPDYRARAVMLSLVFGR
jgi:hypothetical protein